MTLALEHAKRSHPSPSKFCVGAVLVDATQNKVLSTGYSLELPGDRPGDPGTTHAEQCCLIKVAEEHGVSESQLPVVLPSNTVLYTTMEPCNERLSGNKTCVDRILAMKSAIKAVYVGIREPNTFTERNDGLVRLKNAGVYVALITDEGLKERILEASLAGHEQMKATLGEGAVSHTPLL